MTLEGSIAVDEKFRFTLASYLLVLGILANQTLVQSFFLGLLFSLIYIIINGVFLGHTLLEDQESSVKLIFGSFLFVTLSGFVGWLIFRVYRLDTIGVTLDLLICTTIASSLNKVMKRAND